MTTFLELASVSPETITDARNVLGIQSLDAAYQSMGAAIGVLESTTSSLYSLSSDAIARIEALEAALANGAGGPTMVLTPDFASTLEDTPTGGNVLTNDTTNVGALRVIQYWVTGQINAFPAGTHAVINGMGDLVIHGDGEWAFAPAPNWSGVTPAIQYMATNGTDIRLSTLLVTVSSVDDPPIANPNAAMTSINEPVTFGVLGNDIDPEGEATTLTHVEGVLAVVGEEITVPNGIVVRNLDSTLTFTPDTDYEGTTIFQYTVFDGSLSSVGDVYVQVGFENIPLFSPVSPILESDYFDAANANFGNTAMGRVGAQYDNGVNVSDATYSSGQGNFDLGQREPWLYDRATCIYLLYLRTKDPTHLAKALEYAELYFAGCVMSYDLADFVVGGGVPGDPKYLYPIIAWWHERETGSTAYRELAGGLYRQALASFPAPYTVGAALWTERNVNYAMQACLAQYWITGDPVALGHAEEYFETLVTMATTSGAPLHPHSQHEGTSISVPVSSPWMAALLVETLMQLYRTNGDGRIVTWIARYCDFLSDNAFYINNEAPEFLGLRVPAYLVGVGYRDSDAGGPYGDSEHCYDIAILLQKGVWAKTVLGQSTTALLSLINEQLTIATAVFNDWTRNTPGLPKYRVNPTRKFGWWFRGAYSKNYYAGVVPLAPISLTLPTISGNLPAGSVLTATPGTYAGDPTPTVIRRWARAAVIIPGQTGLTYTTQESDVGFPISIEEEVSNIGGTIFRSSLSAIVPTAVGSPTIVTQPTNQVVLSGATAAFTVAFAGSPTPAIQWQISAPGSNVWNDVVGATSGTFNKVNCIGADSGSRIRARGSNIGDTVYSNVVTLHVSVQLGAVAFTASQGATLLQALLPPGAANFTMEALVRIDAARSGGRRILTNRYIAGRTASVGSNNIFQQSDLAVGDTQTGWSGTQASNPTQGEWYLMTVSADTDVTTGQFRATWHRLLGGALVAVSRAKGFGMINHEGFEVNGGGAANAGLVMSVQYVRVYGHQRTLSQIENDLSAVDLTDALFCWVFEDNGSGGVAVRDATGNGRVPTLTGGTLTTGPVAPAI